MSHIEAEKRNQSRYILTTIMCSAESPLSYDELRKHAYSVTKSIQRDNIDIRLIGHRESANNSLFREVFLTMREEQKVCVYTPENAATTSQNESNQYILTPSGLRMLALPATDFTGLTPGVEEYIRKLVADELESGSHLFPDSTTLL